MINYEIGDIIYCLKNIETFIQGQSCKIRGQGDLTMCKSGKTGYGYFVQGYSAKQYFLTIEEINNHFVLYDIQEIKSRERDFKINKIIDV